MSLKDRLQKAIQDIIDAKDEDAFANQDAEDLMDIPAWADEVLKMPVWERRNFVKHFYFNVLYGEAVIRPIVFEIRHRSEEDYQQTVEGTMVGEDH